MRFSWLFLFGSLLLTAQEPAPTPKIVTEVHMLLFQNQDLQAALLKAELRQIDSERNTLLSEICGDIPLAECAIKTDVKPWTVERVKPAPAKPVKK